MPKNGATDIVRGAPGGGTHPGIAANESLHVYLNDHLAGATAGAELARKLAENNEDTATGAAMLELADDIDEDRETLQALMDRIGVDKQGLKQAASWLAEKATRLRFARTVTGSPELSRLLEMEMLSMGIHGKLALWRSLRHTPAAHPALAELDPDLDTLVKRAQEQLDRLEPFRLGAAAEAFASLENG